jgi:hypothetical protein
MLGQRRGSLLSTVKPLSDTIATGTNGSGVVDAAQVVVNAQVCPQQQHARRGSMDVKLEYAIAMINQDATLDSDDRFMSPFGTRRDSVCGSNSKSSKPLQRHVKRSAESA